MKTLLLLLCGVQVLRPASVAGQGQSVAEQLRARVAAESDTTARRVLSEIYGARGYAPMWITDRGVRPEAADWLAQVARASDDGLDPHRYAWVPPAAEPDSVLEVELGLTRILANYARDLSSGRVRPGPRDSIWSASATVFQPGALAGALDSIAPDSLARRLVPPQSGYTRLRAVRARYEAIVRRGGWDSLPDGPDLGPGTRGARVMGLRRRLAAEADSQGLDSGSDVYDRELAQSVRRFQAAHGLSPDGVVGAVTRAALNVTADQRLRQIDMNLERWRWLPRQLGARYIMVNSAAFSLTVVDHDTNFLAMRAIVGRTDWPTPIVISRVTQLVFSPAWEIPKKIALAEIVPLVLSDTGYLAREHMTVVRWEKGAWHHVDPRDVDWRALSESTYTIRLTQAPGNTNPLGGVKFEFGNRFGSYIHDTPQRSLFAQRVRAFSHGCIRAERAARLARSLLADSVQWPHDSVDRAMRGPETRSVALKRGVPVYVCYWTAWVDPDGTVQFRDDVYGWDARLAGLVAGQ